MLVFFFPFFFSSPLHVCSILTKNLKELRFEFSRNDNESKKKKGQSIQLLSIIRNNLQYRIDLFADRDTIVHSVGEFFLKGK